MARRTNRRSFLKASALTGVGYWVAARSQPAFAKSPNEKLNIAGVGVGGQGAGDLANMAGENIVALCDVDENRAGGTFEKFPKAKRYNDYRKLFDEMADKVDAVVVATPDHMHAPISMLAMSLGKHVYCEKPLTHTVGEARRMAKMAADKKLVTQMGNQGHSNPGSRSSVEIIQSGDLGEIKEVHCWSDRPMGWWPQGVDRPTDKQDIPKGLHWDDWLGVAPERPYNEAYLPFKWRGWWDFGTGAMGDMACHVCDIAFWSLDLRDPTSIDCEVSGLHAETAPLWSRIVWEFPKRGKLPPIKLHWYDGGQQPSKDLFEGEEIRGNGSLFVGTKGKLYSPDPYGASYILLPRAEFKDYKPPKQTLPRLAEGFSHHTDWLRCVKAGDQNLASLSNFGYAGAMTEVLLLGNLSVRTGKRIEWDAKNLKVTNVSEANAFIDPPYRKGWELAI